MYSCRHKEIILYCLFVIVFVILVIVWRGGCFRNIILLLVFFLSLCLCSNELHGKVCRILSSFTVIFLFYLLYFLFHSLCALYSFIVCQLILTFTFTLFYHFFLHIYIHFFLHDFTIIIFYYLFDFLLSPYLFQYFES